MIAERFCLVAWGAEMSGLLLSNAAKLKVKRTARQQAARHAGRSWMEQVTEQFGSRGRSQPKPKTSCQERIVQTAGDQVETLSQ